jgi:solute carrier family 13 (sodium-dependent dicarboxylate transporter), member 2/3/5
VNCFTFFFLYLQKNSDSSYRFNRLKFIIMSQSVLFFIIVLVIVFAVMVSSYFHKRHHEFNMGDIEKAVRGAYPAGVRSITKDELVKGVKKHFHCSSKDAHYIIGVARRKKLVDIAATKSGLDVLMAKTLIAPFGKRSENVLLGFMLITGIFSMFISNTATAAMMLTFLTPVFKSLPANGKGRVALTMAIPIGANLGGMGTPIGTPPNAFAYKVLNDPAGLNLGIGFGEWMAIMAPMVIIMLFCAWFIIRKMFPFSQKTIELKIDGNISHNWRTIVVGATFFLTILLWVCGKQLGVNANTVAMLPIAVFAFTGVVTASDLKDIDWAVIWMVAGGFALGLAMNGTGLAENAVNSIPFAEFNPLVIMVVSGLVCFILSNFISNTATAALLIPILTVVCSGMGDKLTSIGGTQTILIGVAVAASCAMSLPISTPPNAIAYSTGLIQQTDMVKAGLTVGVLSMVIGYAVLITFCRLGFM